MWTRTDRTKRLGSSSRSWNRSRSANASVQSSRILGNARTCSKSVWTWTSGKQGSFEPGLIGFTLLGLSHCNLYLYRHCPYLVYLDYHTNVKLIGKSTCRFDSFEWITHKTDSSLHWNVCSYYTEREPNYLDRTSLNTNRTRTELKEPVRRGSVRVRVQFAWSQLNSVLGSAKRVVNRAELNSPNIIPWFSSWVVWVHV